MTVNVDLTSMCNLLVRRFVWSSRAILYPTSIGREFGARDDLRPFGDFRAERTIEVGGCGAGRLDADRIPALAHIRGLHDTNRIGGYFFHDGFWGAVRGEEAVPHLP